MDAMYTMISHKVGSLMVKDDSGHIVGFVTQRDLLRCIVREGKPSQSSYDGVTEPQNWNLSIAYVMTPSKDLVFLSPRDTLEDARALMSISGKRHVPVLSGSELLGVVSPKDIARALHLERHEDISAKASYVSTVMPRKGVPLNLHLPTPADDERAGQVFALRSAVCNLPHPHKNSLGEDAFLLGPNMVGIADGVGSYAAEAEAEASPQARLSRSRPRPHPRHHPRSPSISLAQMVGARCGSCQVRASAHAARTRQLRLLQRGDSSGPPQAEPGKPPLPPNPHLTLTLTHLSP